MFTRDDWTLFRNLNTISQKAGVPVQRLARVVYKEIVDNALDAVPGQNVKFELGHDGWFTCEDSGPGIDLPPAKIAELFSINRPLTSTKILRVPSRGALGNGIRVIVGTVMASGGEMIVETKGRKYELDFDDHTGKTAILHESSSPVKGTKISVRLGDSVRKGDGDPTIWARLANALHSADLYGGKSSVFWYDSDSFYELFMAAGERPVRWLVEQFEGVDAGDWEEIDNQVHAGGPGATGCPSQCRHMTRLHTDALMGVLRRHTKRVDVKKIGRSGWSAKKTGVVYINPGHGNYSAELPFVVEAYAGPVNEYPADDTDETKDEAIIFVNSTPITGEIQIRRDGATKVAFFGCGLRHLVKGVSRRRFKLFLNITIPYMPITTDGKEPNFLYMLSEIAAVTTKATKKFKAEVKKAGGGGQRDIIIRHIREGIAAASGNHTYRYSLRQLFYAIRPYILKHAENGELDYNYFARVITEYEAANGELEGIYRDPRGTLYHPHIGRSIPIGTIAVEEYERPKWTFNKILYCEKEGFFEVLRQDKWPERNDTALLSSKGFASRAVRDVIDLLGETSEEIQVFCVHDADASGTLIYQALVEGTTARAARKVKVVNLGLDPWEAVEMGLQVENFTAKKTLPVARYVKNYEASVSDDWETWLQTQRVELNAMTSPQFLEWLDKKMAPYNKGKVVPPETVLRSELKAAAEQTVRERVMADLLAKGGFETLVSKQMEKLAPKLASVKVDERVRDLLDRQPENRWDRPLRTIASEVVGK